MTTVAYLSLFAYVFPLIFRKYTEIELGNVLHTLFEYII